MATAIFFDHIGLSVRPESLEATIDWYATNLGFAVEQRFQVGESSFAFIIRNGLRIELVGAASSASAEVPADIGSSHTHERLHHLCLAVENLDATLEALGERGIQPITGPFDVPAIGQRLAFVTDNLDNIIELTEPGGSRS